MGQNASHEGREQLRRLGTRMIGSVAYFPERYGAALIRLVLDILDGKDVPGSTFTDHKLVTPANVNHFYPSD
jgi:ribose transport system substrate-binding protein